MWQDLPTTMLVAAFAGAALVIFLSGLRMIGIADKLADRTGLGEALIGAVLLGAATSIGGTMVSVTSALDGRASLAFANAVGGIAAQTVFLAVADMVHRKTNLEHAAADLGNLFQGVVLMVLLTLPFMARTTPEITWWTLHPVSLAIPLIYVASLAATRQIREAPMWKPVRTGDTRTDEAEEEDSASRRISTPRLFAMFIALATVMGVAGFVIARTGGQLADRTGIAETLVGAMATAVVTSLPELVTTVAAVRRGALQLAVGGIIGGNMFDTLFLPAADLAFAPGSLYHAATDQDYFWIGAALLMTGVLIGGLVLRQREGPARIGVESTVLVAIYAAALAVQIAVG